MTRPSGFQSSGGKSNIDTRIVFMGSSDFARRTLRRLFEEGYTIAGVITQPDKPTGRGQGLQGTPLKKEAFELHLPIHQPRSIKGDDAKVLFEALKPDLIVVVAYGKILPVWLLDLPQSGCVNLHASLLPKYRGAAPIQWAIARGETITGVSTMKIEEGLDTGPVYLFEETAIDPEENVIELSDRLSRIGSELMVRTVQGVLRGDLHPQPQDDSAATLAPILKREDGFIDWTTKASNVHNQVRAFNPWPGAVTKFRGATCKILRTRLVTETQPDCEPGSIGMRRRTLTVCCGDFQLLEIIELQPENRKPVAGADFANGARIQSHEKFEPVMDN